MLYEVITGYDKYDIVYRKFDSFLIGRARLLDLAHRQQVRRILAWSVRFAVQPKVGHTTVKDRSHGRVEQQVQIGQFKTDSYNFV